MGIATFEEIGMGILQTIGLADRLLDGVVARVGYVAPLTERGAGHYAVTFVGSADIYQFTSTDAALRAQLAVLKTGDQLSIAYRGSGELRVLNNHTLIQHATSPVENRSVP
jgi:hypothetical protein